MFGNTNLSGLRPADPSVLPAARADPLDDEGIGMRLEPLRNLHPVETYVLHAVGPVTAFAVKMNVRITVVAVALLGAQFIVCDPAPVLE